MGSNCTVGWNYSRMGIEGIELKQTVRVRVN